jgi:hypothetical protein
VQSEKGPKSSFASCTLLVQIYVRLSTVDFKLREDMLALASQSSHFSKIKFGSRASLFTRDDRRPTMIIPALPPYILAPCIVLYCIVLPATPSVVTMNSAVPLLSLSSLLYLALFFSFPIGSFGDPTAECFPLAEQPNTFTCLDTTESELSAGDDCEDRHDSCVQWARSGECKKNPRYMLDSCRLSCNSCLDLHVGETQHVPDDDLTMREAIFNKLHETRQYIYQTVSSQFGMFHKCENQHPMCTYWAVQGDCARNAGFMEVSCPAACQTCHKK